LEARPSPTEEKKRRAMISMNTPKKDVHAIVEEHRDSGFRDAFPFSDGGN